LIKYAWPVYEELIFAQKQSVNSEETNKYLDLYYKSKKLRTQKKTDEAMMLLEEALQYNPKHGKVYLMLAVLHMDKHNYEKAEKYYKISLQHPMKPINLAIAHNNLGELYHDKYGYFSQAIEHFEKSLEIIGDNSDLIDPLDGLIKSYLHNNQFKQAKSLVEKFVCDTDYCKLIKNAKEILPYPSSEGEKLTTTVMNFGGMLTETQMSHKRKRHGFSRVYSVDGKLMLNGNYKDGKEEGVHEMYHQDGTLMSRLVYKEGKVINDNGELFNETVKMLHLNGELATETKYVDGVIDGVVKAYTEDGSLVAESFYKMGIIDAIKAYYESGQLKSEYLPYVKNGIRKKEFYESGSTKEETHVENSRVLSKKVYDEEGNYLGDREHPQIESIEIVKAGIFDREAMEAYYKELSKQKICPLLNSFKYKLFIKETETLSPTLMTSFGIAYRVHGQPEGGRTKLKVQYFHPPLTNPKTGETKTVDEIKKYSKVNEVDTVAWIFEEQWEIVPGEWIIRIFHDNELMIEKSFMVDDQS